MHDKHYQSPRFQSQPAYVFYYEKKNGLFPWEIVQFLLFLIIYITFCVLQSSSFASFCSAHFQGGPCEHLGGKGASKRQSEQAAQVEIFFSSASSCKQMAKHHVSLGAPALFSSRPPRNAVIRGSAAEMPRVKNKDLRRAERGTSKSLMICLWKAVAGTPAVNDDRRSASCDGGEM